MAFYQSYGDEPPASSYLVPAVPSSFGAQHNPQVISQPERARLQQQAPHAYDRTFKFGEHQFKRSIPAQRRVESLAYNNTLSRSQSQPRIGSQTGHSSSQVQYHNKADRDRFQFQTRGQQQYNPHSQQQYHNGGRRFPHPSQVSIRPYQPLQRSPSASILQQTAQNTIYNTGAAPRSLPPSASTSSLLPKQPSTSNSMQQNQKNYVPPVRTKPNAAKHRNLAPFPRQPLKIPTLDSASLQRKRDFDQKQYIVFGTPVGANLQFRSNYSRAHNVDSIYNQHHRKLPDNLTYTKHTVARGLGYGATHGAFHEYVHKRL